MDVESFLKALQDVGKKLDAEFAETIKKECEKRGNEKATSKDEKNQKHVLPLHDFQYLYIESFLSNARPAFRGNKALWTRWIDSVSLCQQETEFLHKFIALEDEPKGTFIARAIALFNATDRLDRCQLGPSMLARLEQQQSLLFE